MQYFDFLEHDHGITLDDRQKSWYIQEAGNQGEHMKREYPSYPEEAFDVARDGAYFSRQMSQIRAKKQITRVPIVPGVPIQTFWDLGRDTTSIWFFQEIGFEYRFVDYYENSGESMAFYLQVLSDRRDGNESYLYGDMYLPHDGTRKSIGSDQSAASTLFDAGYEVRIVERTPDKALSIERARLSIPLCYFDRDMCAAGILCLDGYHKEWDEKHSVWKKMPVHDQFSHGADAFMTFADGYYHTSVVEEQADEVYGAANKGRNATTGY